MEHGKKIFKIVSRRDDVSKGRIIFDLSWRVRFSGKDYSTSIYCAKSRPFDTWKAGDCLEIDLDKIHSAGLKSSDTIRDASIIRILDSELAEDIRDSQVELYELKDARDKLIPVLNNFSQKIINENFFDFFDGEFWFDESALSDWKNRLKSMSDKFEELKRENDNLQGEKNDLFKRFNDVNVKYKDYKNKYEEIRNRSEGERVDSAGEKATLQQENVDLKGQLTDTQRRLTVSEDKVVRLEDRLETRNRETRELTRQLERLQVNKEQAEKSCEELLDEKINLKYGKLEVFANQIGINLQQVSDLCRYCERLVHAQKNFNQANIETHQDNITRVREGLRQNGFQVEDIQKFCNKCEKIAKMRVKLNEIRQQQHEARQETSPLNNNNRIN